MKSHAAALAELAKEARSELPTEDPDDFRHGNPNGELIWRLVNALETEHAQRKQLESRVEKLEGDKDLLITAVTAMRDCDCGNHVFDCDNPPAASDHHETWCNYRVGTSAIKALAADDALAQGAAQAMTPTHAAAEEVRT